VTIEPKVSLHQPRQINHLAPDGILAKDRQQVGKVDGVGVLFGGAPGSDPGAVQGLEQGLRELGQLENKTIVIEYRYADGQLDRVPGSSPNS
jgi:hypothetical protein